MNWTTEAIIASLRATAKCERFQGRPERAEGIEAAIKELEEK